METKTREDVFNILADVSIFMQYPTEDDEICGFVCCKEGRTFSFINSYIIRRLYEIRYINQAQCLQLLQIPDKGERSPIRMLKKRLQIGEEQNSRTNVIKFNGLLIKQLLPMIISL
ncbi:MAG: hypothetical protein PHC92_06915 [Syntrophomonadaceae bacterium]|nr:hypothetical protein [Syntrophomonadaceae bacterium]MDD3023080.1 hypothetical protein [Syntrophomonadaceae bacterium]